MKRLLLLLLLLLLPVQLLAGQRKLAEIQAAYLINFIKYTHWENLEEEAPLHVYIFAPAVYEVLKENSLASIHNQPVIFTEVKKNNVEFKDANVVFISRDMEKYVKESVWKSFSPSTLVVSDGYETAMKGGVIELRIVKGKLRFLVNTSRISGMTISSNLLRMAIEVIK